MNYVPLPDCVTISKSDFLSKITGRDELGLFATKDIKGQFFLGITHIKDGRFDNGYSRTPLGGFFNHNSKDPNCEVVYVGDTIQLVTLRDIKKGEEITVTYTFYDPEK